jgi:SAM-dependent methyltransferase
MHTDTCRSCGGVLGTTMVDLGVMPLANSYLEAQDLDQPEPAFPLRAVVCNDCRLVQLDEVAEPKAIFSDYAYFSSYSDSWLRHAREYVDDVSTRFALGPGSQVVEVASNDGYLLRNFVARGVDTLGIEPAANVAAVAVAAGVPTQVAFFNSETAQSLVDDGVRADLMVANNVLAHVPAINDFVAGFKRLLKPAGVATFEFPHLMRLMLQGQFDTIYHEHVFYFSLNAVEALFERQGLEVFDVQELPTHGGSLRLFVQHRQGPHARTGAVARVRLAEEAMGLTSLDTYRSFGEKASRVRTDLLAFLHEAHRDGRMVAAYGAPAKGNTLLNYCGVDTELIRCTVDRSPHKQGHYLPGTHLPVYDPEVLRTMRPDYLLLLPWNLMDEITLQMAWIADWGGRFVVPIPELRAIASHLT